MQGVQLDIFRIREKPDFENKICAYNSRMNELSNVQLFVRVVDEGSFSAAARVLGVTPSAVSRQVSQLERELGARLFQRTTRRQSLTEAGEIYFQHAHRIASDLPIVEKSECGCAGQVADREHLPNRRFDSPPLQRQDLHWEASQRRGQHDQQPLGIG